MTHLRQLDLRGVVLVVAVLAIGLGFIFSFVGASHDPEPHGVRIAVVAPPREAATLAARLNRLPGGPLKAVSVPRAAAARRQLQDDDESAALIVNRRGDNDRLLLATSAGPALTSAVGQIVTEVDASQHRSVQSTDLVPLQGGDSNGVNGFYMVIGWLICGYFLAAVLAMVAGPGPLALRRVVGILLVLVAYSIAAGLGGMLIVDTLLGALTGHFLALAGVGALLVFTAGAFALALRTLVGIAGIALTIVLLVVLGNPSSGAADQVQLLPGFWRFMGNVLPNGAGVQAIRRIVYFGGHGLTSHLLLIGAYSVGALVAVVGVSAYRSRGTRETTIAQTPHVGQATVG